MIFENYYLYRLGLWLVARLPRWFVDGVAVFVVDLNYPLNRRGRNAIWANLRRVLPPETPNDERRRIAQSTFRNFALSVIDFFRIPQMTRENADQFVTEVRGWEHIRAAMEAGVGGVLMSAHMGSWELAGAYIGLKGVPLTGIALPHRDPRIDEMYLAVREGAGIEVVTVGGAVRKLYQALKQGRFVAVASDRDTSTQGELLPFFGEVTRYAHRSREVGAEDRRMDSPRFGLSSAGRPDGHGYPPSDSPRPWKTIRKKALRCVA